MDLEINKVETPAFYKDMEFSVAPGVYDPDEDTFLLADDLGVNPGEEVLEIGTGCGILAILAAKAGAKVTATDVNPSALDCARKNASAQGVDGKIDFRLGDLFEPVAGEHFNLVIFNPPYLPATGKLDGDPTGVACEGGSDGRALIDPFLESLPEHLKDGGRAIYLQSSLSSIEQSIKKMRELGLVFSLKSKKFCFEELFLVFAKRL